MVPTNQGGRCPGSHHLRDQSQSRKVALGSLTKRNFDGGLMMWPSSRSVGALMGDGSD
jgi:hypothetical protein